MKNQLYFAALLLFLQGCKIDADLSPPCSEPGGWGFASIVTPENKPYRNAPSANPLNDNEFAYIANQDGIEGYWKFDLSSNSKELIAVIDPWEPPDWSIKDWIVFGSNAQIFICKSNGDSLTQLTFENENYNPSWSPDGEKIIFEKDENDAVQNFAVMDLSGNIVTEYKSTIYAGQTPSWSPDGEKIAFVSTSNPFGKILVAYFDVDNPGEVHYVLNSDIQNNGVYLTGPLDWYDDSETILFTESGDIYSANIMTNTISLIKEGVGCSRYSYHSILSNSMAMITVWHESNYDEVKNIEYHDYDLVEIKSDGTEVIIPY